MFTSLNAAIILAVSLFIVGLCLLAAGRVFYKMGLATRENTRQAEGVLVSFRFMYKGGVNVTNIGNRYDVDYTENASDRYPVFTFTADGKEYSERAEVPYSGLTAADIGRTFSIRYSDEDIIGAWPGDVYKQYKVIIDDDAYWQTYYKEQGKTFNVFRNIAVVMFAAGVLALLIIPRFK